MSHPEELLAAYVDGSLEEDERALVDGHLAGCETCRVEVGDARRARAALSGLPELDVPPGTVRPALTRRPARDRFRRASWVAGAAAASIAAVVALVLVANQGGGGGAENAGAPRAAAGGSVGREYDRNRINRLAVNLAQDA